jgi:hypothetical protein
MATGRGPAVRVPDLVDLLEHGGYAVEYTPPTYVHSGADEPDDMATAVLYVSGQGSGRSIAEVLNVSVSAIEDRRAL